jgi:hypothetical protein
VFDSAGLHGDEHDSIAATTRIVLAGLCGRGHGAVADGASRAQTWFGQGGGLRNRVAYFGLSILFSAMEVMGVAWLDARDGWSVDGDSAHPVRGLDRTARAAVGEIRTLRRSHALRASSSLLFPATSASANRVVPPIQLCRHRSVAMTAIDPDCEHALCKRRVEA